MTEAKGGPISTQWVIFTVGAERFGVAAVQVQEIVRLPDATMVPDMPKFVKGVMNLRGKIIPLMDVQERFGIGGKNADESKRRVVVATFGEQLVGLIVHSVIGVVRIPAESIDPLPATLPRVEAEYISGVAKVADTLVVLLALDRMLGDMERMILSQLTAQAEGGAAKA
jgi:purine-binding chemotaxis protein CheW